MITASVVQTGARLPGETILLGLGSDKPSSSYVLKPTAAKISNRDFAGKNFFMPPPALATDVQNLVGCVTPCAPS
jgi:hypothetical protein